MKKNVLLLSEQLSDAKTILNTYYSSKDFEPQLVFETDKALVALLGGDIELLVFNVDDYDREKLESILDLRLIGDEFPILTLANNYSEKAYSEIEVIDKAILLSKPYKDDHLLKVSKKMAENKEEVKQRWADRYDTEENASIQIVASNGEKGKKAIADVKNLSRRGGLLACNDDADYHVGQIIYIEFLLDEKKKKHTFFAKVAWQQEEPKTKQCYLGVKFLTKEELLNELI